MTKNKLDLSSYFVISSSCRLTKGCCRTIIQDFKRNYADYVPNDYYELCSVLDRHKISEIIDQIDEESQDNFMVFIDFMLEKEYAFLTGDISLFPPISTELHETDILTDAIVEIDCERTDKAIVTQFLNEIDDMGCRCLQVRLYSCPDNTSVIHVSDFVCQYDFNYIEIHIDSATIITYDECCNLLLTHAQISNLFLYNALKYEARDYNEMGANGIETQIGSVVYIQDGLDSCHCGIVNKYCHVYGDMTFYLMSQNMNSCLYRKISLDRQGNVRNCPSAPEKYDLKIGLRNILQSDEFRKYWTIKKDDIDTCRDCEYRYNCLDCRFHTKDGGLYSKPATCQYDPYNVNKTFED